MLSFVRYPIQCYLKIRNPEECLNEVRIQGWQVKQHGYLIVYKTLMRI
jgi:hypothetical protein